VPLALRIVAAQLAAFPALSVAELAARLADEPGRMRTFTVGHKSVRGSLDLSFRLLDRTATRAMVALAALGSPTFTGWLLAPLLGRPADRSDELVERLASMHLLEPVGPGMDGVARYRMHDLVRAYCRGLRRELDEDAVDRLVGWAVGLAVHAAQGITRRQVRYQVATESGADLGPDVLGQVIKEPLAWAGADVDVLLAVFELAVHRGRRRAAAALLLVLRKPLVRLDLLDHLPRAAARLDRLAGPDPVVRVSAALVAASTRLHRGWYTDAARALTAVRPELADVDPAIRAEVLLMLGDAYERCCDVPNALVAFGEAAQWFAASDDIADQAACHCSLSALNLNHVHDIEAALWHACEALRLADLVSDWKLSAMARVAVVHASLVAGDLPTARRRADEAIALAERDGDPVGQTWCLVLNAQVLRADSDLTEARTATDRALELARRIRRPDAESAAHLERARIELDAGDRATARRRAQAALELADRFDSPVERGRIEQLLTQLAD
jgi:tetratricopeptide (TPR) repeat protein